MSSANIPPSRDRPAPWAIGLLMLSLAASGVAGFLLGLDVGLF